jgi:hypothetical protein
MLHDPHLLTGSQSLAIDYFFRWTPGTPGLSHGWRAVMGFRAPPSHSPTRRNILS